MEDETTGLNVRAEAESPAAIIVRNHDDPFGLLLRALDGFVANPAQRTATQGDIVTFTGPPGLVAKDGRLVLPRWAPNDSGSRPLCYFTRWFETIIKPE